MPMNTLFQSIRPSFLILAPICVFLGTSTALATRTSVDPLALVLIVIGAVCAHISVNTLNEYADFKSGLDLITIKTPFSGGSGALPANPAMANMVLATGLITLSITAAIGLYFVKTHGAPVLAIGIIGTTIILTYTRWINHWALLCLIAPGLGFGILMVVGTHYVLTQEISTAAWLAALVPFFLVNNLLLLNQFPDIDADRSIGRRHLPITSGTRFASYVYGVLSGSAYLVILLGIYYGHFPLLSLIATVPVVLSLFSLSGALRYGDKIGAHQQYLGANVAVTLLVPALLGISIIVA